VYLGAPTTLTDSLTYRPTTLPPPLVVMGPLDREALAVRIGAIASRDARLIVLDSDRVWHARLARVLHTVDIRLVVIDTTGLAAGAAARWALLQQLVRRAGDLMHAAHIVLLSPPAVRPPLALPPGSTYWQYGDLVPAAVAFSCTEHTSEDGRLASLAASVRAAAGSVLLVTPSRGVAESVAAVLRGAALDAAAYHGGLLQAERAALFAAFSEGRLRVLVATEAIQWEATLPSPALLLFSHPPHSLESLVVLAGRAERATQRTPVVVHVVAGDHAVRAAHSQAGVPAIAALDRAYEGARRRAVRGTAVVDLLQDRGATRERSAALGSTLTVLDAAGLLVRRSDFARGVTVELLGDDPHALAPVDAVVPLRQGLPLPIDPVQVARRLGWQPHRLHAWLLDAEERGLVQVRPFGREAVYTVRPRTAERDRHLRHLVRDLTTAQAAEVQLVQEWCAARTCRAQMLATQRRWAVADPGGRCDRGLP
jgi:hypothetical protein